MSVLIKMEMPKSCYECPLKLRESRTTIVCPIAQKMFSVADTNFLDYRLDNCPLIPVPEHGDLIDRDALPTTRVEWYDIADAPVVIPADKEKIE